PPPGYPPSAPPPPGYPAPGYPPSAYPPPASQWQATSAQPPGGYPSNYPNYSAPYPSQRPATNGIAGSVCLVIDFVGLIGVLAFLR
ncbi:MAG: hypothetical protein ACRDTV_09795, partial [Mycobacterium sp.]